MTVLASFPRWYGGKFFSSLCSYYTILCIRLWNKIVSSICVFISIFTDPPSFFIFKRLHLRSREYKQNISIEKKKRKDTRRFAQFSLDSLRRKKSVVRKKREGFQLKRKERKVVQRSKSGWSECEARVLLLRRAQGWKRMSVSEEFPRTYKQITQPDAPSRTLSPLVTVSYVCATPISSSPLSVLGPRYGFSYAYKDAHPS